MKGVHGIAGVTGGTLPAEIWHTYMTGALEGQPVEQFESPGSPPYKPWCGRYQFARTWHDARPHAAASTSTSRRSQAEDDHPAEDDNRDHDAHTTTQDHDADDSNDDVDPSATTTGTHTATDADTIPTTTTEP